MGVKFRVGTLPIHTPPKSKVLRDFDVGEATPFSHVLTPFFDAHHENHFHLDLSRFRADGTRPQ